MTHETKLGILVSCSFLGLLGYLYVAKNREVPATPEKDKPKAVAEVAPPTKRPAARAQEHVDKVDHTPTAKPEITPVVYQTPMPNPPPPGNLTVPDLPAIQANMVVPDLPPGPGAAPPPPNPTSPTEVPHAHHNVPAEQGRTPHAEVKPEQLKALAFLGFGAPAPVNSPNVTRQGDPAVELIPLSPPAALPGTPVPENKPLVTIIPPSNNNPIVINTPTVAGIAPLPEVRPVITDPTPGPGIIPVSEPRVGPGNPPMPPPNPPMPPPNPPMPTPNSPLPELKPDPNLPPLPPIPPPPASPMPVPAITPMATGDPIPTRPVATDPAGQAPPGITIKPIKSTEVAAPLPKPEQSNPTPLPPSLGNNDQPRQPSTQVAPALGAPTSDTPGRPVAQGNPQVRSFTEKIYTWKTGDNYDKLSQDYYYTKNVAPALKKYNQSHPMATDNLRNGGDPAPGERIYLPPLRQLEDGDQASKPLTPLPAGAAANAAPGTLPTYKVTQDNTYIVNVALDTLKKGERWVELRQLNPQINPEVPLPIGTILRLPADAVVPPGAGR